MDRFSAIVTRMDDAIWSMLLVALCLGVGLFLSLRMRFPQLRLLKEMGRVLKNGEEDGNGITPFQAFATTVGARVGMGNIAGVASAIFYGGPAYYIERGLKCKPYAILFAVVAFLGPGVLMPGVQINSLVTVFEEAFSVDKVIVGVICCIVLAIVVFGSIKRIARIAELLAPLMCAIYMGLAIVILGMNITRVPVTFAMIFQSAFGLQPLFGGILGSAIAWGVKRGIYSNEAGMGCGAIVSAAAECSHPAKQGLVQAFSIYVDTLLVGTSTALIILLTGTYDVTDGAGNLLLDQTGGIEAGIKWTQHALMSSYGSWSGKLLAVIIVLFVFTSMTGYCYQAEANIRYLTGGNERAITLCRMIFVLASFMGCLVSADAMWALGDIGYGLMAWANIIAILLLSKQASAILKDYEVQKKEKKRPVFDPAKFGISDDSGAWAKEK